MKKIFTAIRANEIIMIMQCSSIDGVGDEVTKEYFIEALKKAITHYVTHNDNGKRIVEYSGGDFNFGDLALIVDDSSFVNILTKYGIFSFSALIVDLEESSFSYDMLLLNN